MMVQCVEQRFGTIRAPHPVQWLSDNGSIFAAHKTIEIAVALNLVPCFTPVESPESNGMAEAFVKTFKRDYVRVSPIPDALPRSPHRIGWRTTTPCIRIPGWATAHRANTSCSISTRRVSGLTGGTPPSLPLHAASELGFHSKCNCSTSSLLKMSWGIRRLGRSSGIEASGRWAVCCFCGGVELQNHDRLASCRLRRCEELGDANQVVGGDCNLESLRDTRSAAELRLGLAANRLDPAEHFFVSCPRMSWTAICPTRGSHCTAPGSLDTRLS